MTSRNSSSRRAALVLAWRFVRGLVRGLGRLLLALVAAGGLTALLVGVPWGLVRFIGWPLPDHMPSIEEVTTWLFHGTMGTDTLLDLLAIALWIIWVFFVADVARSAVDAARGMRWPEVELPSTPGQWVASLLIGWLLLALLGHRGPPAALAAPHEVPTVSPVAATAPQHPGGNSQATVRKVIVAAPTAGTHDSLWRIAERHLGDGARWTEIWDLNKYRPQPDGRVFTQPDLIQPGWTLTLPVSEHAGDHPHPPEEPPDPPQPPEQVEPSDGEPEATSPPGSTATPEQADTAGADDAAPSSDSGAVDLGNGVFLSLTVAAAISAALVAARHRFRRLWVLGRSSYDPMPVAPTVYELRLAHLAATHTNDPDGGDNGEHRERPVPVALVAGDPTSACGEPDAVALGVRDGVPVASKLARRGLGLAGPAANAAARAMLIALLTSETTQVVVPVDDLPLLIEDPPDRLPTGLRIVPDLAAALAELDPSSGGTDAVPGRRVLVASPPANPPDTARLRALLASGTASAAAILLGQYLPGATVYVAEDGTVAATSPGAATALQGTRMFTATAPATTDLLDLLATADVNLPPRQPADREPEAPTVDAAPPADRTGETTSPHAPEVPAEGDDTDGGRPRPATPTTPDAAADTQEPDQPTERHAATPAGDPAASVGLRLSVLGPFTATLTAPSGEQRRLRLGNKTQELLTYLAVHRDGVGRDTLIADLWRDSTHSSRRTNNLNSALRRLRDALDAASNGDRPEVIVGRDNRVQLNPDTVGVDYWDFDDARTHARAAATDDQRHHAYRAQVASYGGRLGIDLDDAEWVHGPDYNAQCAVVDALGRLATAAETTDPQHALDLLETARGYDPANESLYGAIMRLQAALCYHDAIDRTLSLLEAELAERKDKPSAEIVGLARSLRRRHTTAIASQTPEIATHINDNRPRTMAPQNTGQSRSHHQ